MIGLTYIIQFWQNIADYIKAKIQVLKCKHKLWQLVCVYNFPVQFECMYCGKRLYIYQKHKIKGIITDIKIHVDVTDGSL